MNLINDNLDILQNIESAVVTVATENPALKDAHVLLVYEKLQTLFDRQKRKLPELPILVPADAKQLLLTVRAVCESRLVGHPDEIEFADNISADMMARLLKRLVESVKKWTKENGAKGYIQFIDGYVI